ncbi:Uncharacterised protein [Klebsiella variicola]|uniref:hypothetical protein n=1 Tax=Klebsiella variicola TaxID=244366 RepID=UPI000E2B9C42|nr:hypothetical protein [Klebsiella variicola]SXF08897.1 Uncharacterised protein [Klebsiella variicola]
MNIVDEIELGKGKCFKCGRIIELKRSVIKENDNYQNVYTLTIEDINADQISYEYSSHESKIGNELVGSILYFIVKDNKITKLTSSDAEQLLDVELPYKKITSVKTAFVSGFWAVFGVALACSSVPYLFGTMIQEAHLDKTVFANGMALMGLYMYISVVLWAAVSFSIKNRLRRKYNQDVASKKYNAKLLVDCVEKAFSTKSDEKLTDNS